MKKELNPAVFWTVLVVLVVVVAAVGYRMLGSPSFKADTTGSEQTMQKVQQGGKMYEPPAGAPVPGAPGYTGTGGPGSMPMGAPTGPGGTTAPAPGTP